MCVLSIMIGEKDVDLDCKDISAINNTVVNISELSEQRRFN